MNIKKEAYAYNDNINQIDCERRFNLNWLRKSFFAMTFFIILLPAPYPNQELFTISTPIAKIQQRKIESVYLGPVPNGTLRVHLWSYGLKDKVYFT